MIRGLPVLVLIAQATCLGLCGPFSVANAQTPKPRHVGVLLATSSPEETLPQAFRQGLIEAGYVEGRDVVIEWRSAKGAYQLLPQLAADLVQRKVDAIVIQGMPAAQAAKGATSTIPIVLAVVSDPVAAGLVVSLAHPGGNITGLSAMTEELSAKRLQLLKEAIPQLARITVLWNPDTSFSNRVIEQLKTAASSMSIELKLVSVRKPEEIGPAFLSARRAQARAVYVIEDALLFRHRATIIKLGFNARLPIVYSAKEFTHDGELLP